MEYKKFEYKTIECDWIYTEDLNKESEDGWEFVCATPLESNMSNIVYKFLLTFKRQIIEIDNNL